MISTIRDILLSILPVSLFKFLRKKYHKKQLNKWIKNGRPLPPPHVVKQLAIAFYQAKYGHKVFVETGTYKGDMIEIQKENFSKLYSIELDGNLYKKAVERFKNQSTITILQGDSGQVIPKILETLNEPAIFWLDGHYSGGETAKGDKDCPIIEELDFIFKANSFNHVLLIDDARCFNGTNDYPTLEKLSEFVKSVNGNYTMEVKDDIIRLTI